MPAPRLHKLDLALQGGGAHGAFTWGVVERLLEEEGIWITALSGASAGAINAAVMASGLATGGRQGASRALWAFWKALSRSSRDAGPLIPMIEAFPLSFEAVASWWSNAFGTFTLPNTPELGSAAQKLLRDLLEQHIDFDALRSDKSPRLFISATDVRTGGARIFRNEEMSVDVLLASACLPLMFPPVTIDGAAYWDGGYSANPPILSLVQESPSDDLLLVTINPASRDMTPRTSGDISNRLTELNFSQTLVKDLRGLVLLQSAVGRRLQFGNGLLAKVKRLRIHEIHDEPTLAAMHPRSKMIPVWKLLIHLHAKGRDAAANWVANEGKLLGKSSTAHLAERYGPK